MARRATWRGLHPGEREPYVEPVERRLSKRLWARTEDGWDLPIELVEPGPGSSAEPVVLLHGLGVGGEVFRYGPSSLAAQLSSAGFSVYIAGFRGDRAAVAPASPAIWCADDLVDLDLPALVDRVRDHSGYDRPHVVGHGLGGQVALVGASQDLCDRLATLTVLNAAVSFRAPRSEAVAMHLASLLVPGGLRVRSSDFARWMAPGMAAQGPARLASSTSGARIRGVFEFFGEDLAVGLLRQVASWWRAGTLCDRTGLRDWTLALSDGQAPLMVVCPDEDPSCPSEAALLAAERWGGPSEVLTLGGGWSHLDTVLGRDAPIAVSAPITAFLERHRRLAWGVLLDELQPQS